MNNYFFEYYQNETKQNIEKNFEDMTQLEKSIGEFFIKNKSVRDFSSKGISGLLYVSEASLHRFAKKCGYKGYREFIFSYEKDKAKIKEADIVLITANDTCEYANICNEVIKVSYPKGLANVISVQMVTLMTMDVIYSYCSANKNYFKAIKKEKEGNS